MDCQFLREQLDLEDAGVGVSWQFNPAQNNVATLTAQHKTIARRLRFSANLAAFCGLASCGQVIFTDHCQIAAFRKMNE